MPHQDELTATGLYVFLISQVIQAISMIAPLLTPDLLLLRIAIITNNDWDIPSKFSQAITIAVGHDGDCYVQFEHRCKQLYHVEKIFK